MRVDVVFLRAASSEAEVDDGEFSDFGVGVLDALECLGELLHSAVHLSGVADDLLQLTHRLELLLAFCALHGVSLLLVLDLLVGVQLHYCIMVR